MVVKLKLKTKDHINDLTESITDKLKGHACDGFVVSQNAALLK